MKTPSHAAALRFRGWWDAGRAGLGATAALACTSVAAALAATGRISAEPMLIAPIGASAVLVFAIPASPLAQPRAVIGGNVLSCLVGLAAAALIPHHLAAGAVAVGAAIVAMLVLRCLHPPGGAIALATGLAGAPGLLACLQTLGPILTCSLLLTLAATVYVNLTGRTYPHKAARHETTAVPARGMGFTEADLDNALAQYGELLDVSRDDLDILFRQVELQVHRRIHSAIRCEDIMSREVIAVHDDQSCESALAFLQKHDLRTAPVVDGKRRVMGLVRRAELLAGGGWPVSSVVDPFVHKVRPSSSIEALLPVLSSGATHEAMVVDENRRLVGVITQTDLLAVLYRAHIVEAVVAQRAA